MDDREMNPSRTVTEAGGSVVSLRVDRVTDRPAGPAQTVYCTDIEGTELRVTITRSSATDLSVEAGQWYRFDGVVQSRSLEADLRFPFEGGSGSPERIDAPERQTPPSLAELNEPWLIQLGASEQRIAVTVQPRPTDGTADIRAGDPETFEIGAVCFADCDGTADTTVYHREEPDTRDEHLLLQHVVEDLSAAEGATLVTRGGDHSPLEMLQTRLAPAADGDVVDGGAERVLEGCFHANLEHLATGVGAGTLGEAAKQLGIEAGPVRLSEYDIGLDPDDWREDWERPLTSLADVSDPRMTDRDYAVLVERYLAAEGESVESAQLGQCLKAHASVDLDVLCELATHDALDRVGCSQLTGRRLRQDSSV